MTETRRGDAASAGGLSERTEAAASTARDEASQVAGSAKSELQDVRGEAMDQAKAVAEDAKIQARNLVDESRRQLSQQASEQTARLAGSVRDVSQQLHKVVTGGEAPQGLVADVADQAAQVTARFADTLEQRRPEELLDEVRRFARRRPGTFLLAAAGAGFLAGRLIRSVDTQQVMESAKTGAGVDGSGGQGEGPAATPPRQGALSGTGAATTAGVAPTWSS